MAGVITTTIRATALGLSILLTAWAPVDAAAETRGDLTPNQLTDGRTLSWDEALAACGPAAAVALARASGRDVTLDGAVALAREVGWTANGMGGPQGLLSLLRRLGVSASLEDGIDRSKIVREVQAGRPVIIRNVGEGGHYLVAERYDPKSGAFDFGQSAIALKRSGGSRWFTLSEIGSLGAGTPAQVVYMGNTLSAASRPAPAPIAAPTSARAAHGGRVISAEGLGANLRAEPSIQASVVGAVPDGARVTDLGAEVAAGGRTWRRVVSPQGGSAWIDAGLLLPIGR